MATSTARELRGDVAAEVQVTRQRLEGLRERFRSALGDPDSAETEAVSSIAELCHPAPSRFGSLRDRVVALGGPERHLQRVIRAEEELDDFVEANRSTVLLGDSREEFHTRFEAYCGALSTALDAVEKWARGWKPPESRSTGYGRLRNLALLDEHEVLDMNQLAEVLGVTPHTARRRVNKGEFRALPGSPVRVRSSNVSAVLGLDS